MQKALSRADDDKKMVKEASLSVERLYEDVLETISIEVKLSGRDLKNVRRILENKFEPERDAWLVVKVKAKKK